MTLTVASSTFTSGPKDELAAPDIYKLDPKKLITSIPIKASELSNIFSAITTKNGKFDVTGALDQFNKYDISAGLADSIKQLGANAREIGSDITKGATTLLEKATPGAKALSCTVGEYASKISWKDTKACLEIGAAVSSMNGSKDIIKVVNKAANTGIMSGVIEKASNMGMGGVFDSLKTTMQENGITSRVIKAAVPFVISNSDVKLLNEIAGGGFGRAIDAVSPGFTKAFTSVYRTTGSNINNIDSFNGMIDAFDQISKDWDKVPMGGGLIGTITNLFSSSNAFRSVVYSGVMYGINYALNTDEQKSKNERLEAMALASIYRESTVSEQIAKYFPNIVMIGKYNRRAAKEETVDIKMVSRAARLFLS